ncbi:MAG: aminoglycoside adenylyltransferase domain-containing protein [Pacificimonas sp.]|nr:aminoglycoside adenylyltransferase domain-containing protein [Pacificimonas sp.]
MVVDTYLNALTERVRGLLGDDLLGLYLHGSAVQGDVHPGASDIDILGVLAGPLGPDTIAGLESALADKALSVPAAGLEFILCTETAARRPAVPFPFAFALSTGPAWTTCSEPAGIANDTLIDIALCQKAGRTLYGPPPSSLFGPVSKADLRAAILEELQWHRDHLDRPVDGLGAEDGVLNAARAVHAAQTGRLASKSEGGRLWLRRHPGDDLVAEALERRADMSTSALDRDRAEAFIVRAIRQIEVLPQDGS